MLADGFTASDLYYAEGANGLALRALPTAARVDDDRRARFFVDSLRPR